MTRIRIFATVFTVVALVLLGASGGSAQASGVADREFRAEGAAHDASAVTAPASVWSAGGLVTGNARSFTPSTADGSTYGGCTFYANSYSTGGFCASSTAAGGTWEQPPTLGTWLNQHDYGKFYPCRYFALPRGFEVHAPGQGDGRYVFLACFEGYDYHEPWNAQTELKVDLQVRWVSNAQYGSGIAYLNRSIPDYMYEFWDTSANQQFYPIAQLMVQPTIPARVNTYTYFQAHWVRALDAQDDSVDPELRIPFTTSDGEQVTIHAQVSSFKIRPELGAEPIECGKADVPYDPEADNRPESVPGGEQESTCWYMFEHSSADEDDGFMRVGGRVVWHVAVEDANGNEVLNLGEFPYVTKQRLLVGEQQQAVEWGQDS